MKLLNAPPRITRRTCGSSSLALKPPDTLEGVGDPFEHVADHVLGCISPATEATMTRRDGVEGTTAYHRGRPASPVALAF
jgi:hypothetical protein